MVAIPGSPEPASSLRIDEDLRRALRDNIEALVGHLGLGRPTDRSGDSWRWGRKGSLKLTICGPDAGLWFDFEAGEGGDLIDLIRRQMGGTAPEAAGWARGVLGLGPAVARRAAPAPKAKPANADARPAHWPKATPMHEAIWSRGVRITGTLAEVYLGPRPDPEWQAENHRVYSRGIPPEVLARLPDTEVVRFIPATDRTPPAVAFKATNERGEMVAIQLVRLNQWGTDKISGWMADPDSGPGKKSYGPLAEALVRLPGAGDPVIVEGPEDGLTVWAATGRPVLVALGSFKNIASKATAIAAAHPRVTLGADRDAPGSPAAKALLDAAAALAAAGCLVSIAVPPALPYRRKSDWNDILLWHGLSAVAAGIASALPYAPALNDNTEPTDEVGALQSVAQPVIVPTYPLPTATAEQVRAVVRTAVEHVGVEVLSYWALHAQYEEARALIEAGKPVPLPPGRTRANLLGRLAPDEPCIAIRADTGVGKSSVTRSLIGELLVALPGRKVVFAVPTVDLADEAAREARALGLRAVAIRGRDRAVPAELRRVGDDDTATMCDDLDAVKDCVDAVIGVQNSVCIRRLEGVERKCQCFDSCRYQQQRQVAQQADVIYMAHQYLFHEMPEFIENVALLVIDETFYSAGLYGTDKKRRLSAASLEAARTILHRDGSLDHAAMTDWNAYSSALARAIRANRGRWLSRVALETEGITREIAEEAEGLAWRLREAPGIIPAMEATLRRDLAGRVMNANRFAKKAVQLWGAVADLLRERRHATGHVWCDVIDIDEDGGEMEGAILLGRADIRRGWRLPTLVLDATLRPELVVPYLPYVEVLDTPAVAMPHAQVRQIIGAPVTAHKLIAGEHRRAKDNVTACNHQMDMHRFLRLEARGKGRVLAVAQMEAEAALRDIGLPANIDTAHFGATTGRNDWQVVDSVIPVGRPLPGPQVVEMTTAALTGEPIPLSPDGVWYRRVEGAITRADGTGHPMTMDRHPHPVAEAIRWRICEGELLQVIGRGRGVNRTAADPLSVVIVSDVVLPLAVDEVEVWRAPDRHDEMALRGVVLENAADMARAYPDLWATHKAAERDRQNRGLTQTPIGESIYRRLGESSVVTYRPAGPGHKSRTAIYDPTVVPDIRAWLVERLGPLAQCEVVTPPTADVAPAPQPAAPVAAPLPAGPVLLGARPVEVEPPSEPWVDWPVEDEDPLARVEALTSGPWVGWTVEAVERIAMQEGDAAFGYGVEDEVEWAFPEPKMRDAVGGRMTKGYFLKKAL